MWQIITTFLFGSGVLALVFYGAVWLLKASVETLLARELDKTKNSLAKELELHKRKLDLEYNHKLSLQDRRRKLYEELSNALEEIFKEEAFDINIQSDEEKASVILNKLFGLLALYAPDDVYLSVKKSLDGKVVANEAKPIIYSALRKSLFGEDTKLTQNDLVKHVNAKHIKVNKD